MLETFKLKFMFQLEESISLDGLDDIPWESYSPDEKFVYYTFAFEHDSNGKVVAFPKVKKVAFQSLNACASRDELIGKDYNVSYFIFLREFS